MMHFEHYTGCFQLWNLEASPQRGGAIAIVGATL